MRSAPLRWRAPHLSQALRRHIRGALLYAIRGWVVGQVIGGYRTRSGLPVWLASVGRHATFRRRCDAKRWVEAEVSREWRRMEEEAAKHCLAWTCDDEPRPMRFSDMLTGIERIRQWRGEA